MKNNKLSHMLIEGVYDPSIFKAIFIVGSPGSGKSHIIDNLGIQEFGLKLLDSDREFTHYLKKLGKSLRIDPAKDPDVIQLRNKAVALDNKFKDAYTSGRLGVVVSGTGYNVDVIKNKKTDLESLGYDTYIIFVNTSMDIAMKRNRTRERTLDDDVVATKWALYTSNIGTLQSMFGSEHFFVFDNSTTEQYSENMPRLYKVVNKWLKTPLSYMAKLWISKNT